ncbi:hypothetical protein MJ588_03030 [Klebsiella pneumoniae]|nr:hypothetical protein MJ588_03030 [Klebsiella pneumoniae]
MGEAGEGVWQILKMGGLTRFDCALGSHGLMRRACSVALFIMPISGRPSAKI